MNMASKSPKSKSGSRRICVFCDQNDICQEMYGKLLSKAGVTAHYFCMLFSSGLSQNGKSEKQGILGFLQSDIVKEVKRGARLRCSYCRKTGATIGCVIRNCKKMFHLGCGRNNSTLHQFFGTFSSFCPAHRVQQEVPSDDDPSIVCSICMNTVTAAPSNDTIRAPCCRKYWYHRDCVQRYATSAGLYFFKCPLCNNKDDFQDEMLTMGIYIPDQDASWEKEPHAFQELLERYSHCDAPVCKCVEGRKYDKEGSKWEIILCDFCGSHGAHVACNHLEKLGKHDICHGCKEVDERTREEEYLMNSPPSKRKSLELLQLELASSPDPSKGASPYPGPSDALRKVGLPSPQAGISPRASSSTKNKSGTKKGKRLASPETSEIPPKVKKRKLYKRKSETVTSATAKGRRTADSLLSSNTSSQSSDDTSDDDLPFSVLKNKLNKMELESAWDVRRRKRMEYKKKHAEKKEKKKTKLYESDSEIDVKKKKELGGKKRKVYVEDSDESETAQTKQKEEKENRAKKSTGNANNNHTVSDSETDNCSQIVDVIKVKAHEKHESDKRLSLPVKISGKGKEVKKTRKSADRLVVSSVIDQKVKQGKSKKRSLENDKNQTTLTSWLTQKPKQDLDKGYQAEQVQMNKKNKSEHVKIMIEREHVNERNKYEHVKVMNKTEPVPVNTAKNKKKPVVIEWMGKQLIIKSPKVVLRRNRSRKALKMRPKNLEIDMNDVKGCSDWNRDIDMLSNLETDVRVTRKMVDIDQRDTKNEKGRTNLALPTRCPQKQEQVEPISPMKKTKNVENFTKLGTLELNNNEVLTSVQTERSGKVDLPFEGYSDSERPVESEGHNEMVEERVGSLILEELEDSPAKNLRGRKTREEISNSVSADTILRPAANVLKEFPDKNSPMKNIESLKSVLHQSPKSSVARADSPAKNLRPRMKRDQKRNTLDDETYPDNLEKENQHTPTIEKNCFNFTVIKDKKPSDDTELPPEKGSNLIRVKESAEFGSVILRNDTHLNEHFGSELKNTTATIERLKLYKPQMPVTSETEDSPAKNLRKRNQTIKDPENNAYSEAVNVEEVGGKATESDISNIAVSDQLQRLKKYKPRFKYLSEGYGTDLKGKNSEKEMNHSLETMKEVGKEVARTSKDTTEVSDTSKQPSIIWHLEGTKQVNKSRPDYLNSGCENTCPNPQPNIIYANEANLDPVEKTKTNSPRRKSFSLDDILEERLNEINNTFPTTNPELDSPEESCNTAASLSPSYFTKFRRSCSRSESLESFSSKASSSKISIENGAVVIKNTAPSPEQESPVLTFSQTKKNLLDAMRNKSVAKLRFSPRPKKPSAQGHASDKMSMAEYYGASLKSDPRLKKKSASSVATDDEGNDIGELPSLISASIVM